MVEQIFTQEAVEKLQPYIQKTVDDLLEDLKQKRGADGPVHLAKIFALPVPSYIIYTIFGAPFHDLDKLCTEQVKPRNIEKADAVQISFLLLVASNATMVNMIALAIKRTAKEDVEISGKLIRANTGVIASNQSANRHEDVLKNPDQFDMDCKGLVEDALGFGFGDRCIAEHLAKTEPPTVFDTY
ncbi:cytochrome P450 monooxygenase 55A1 [Fusarium beomiforme]|uniref:Cytochrome P450 monooxygenase 55A1 n=1 Tax=Fusarium beomiforme TaxID=44412 RepID=A0A9P5DY81_9HYPO|nr:cytochrome P450 monooxygenase 55A1 [Fusarium beomiforme]